MKKVISYMMAVMLLLGMMSVSYAAEEKAVIAKGETKLEYETYNHLFNTPGRVCDQTNTAGNLASGGAYVYWDTADRTEDIFSDIPVTVKEAGFYEITVIASRINCFPHISVDGNIVLDGKNASCTKLDEAGEDGKPLYFKKFPFYAYSHKTVMYLTEGDHTVHTNINRRTLPEDGAVIHDVASCIDNIIFRYLDAIDFNEKSIHIEYENVFGMFDRAPGVYTLSNKPGNLASGGGYIHWDTEATDKDITGNMPIYLKKGGFFEVSMKCSYTGPVELHLDENVIFRTKNAESQALDEAGEDGVFPYFGNIFHHAREYTNVVYIPQGTHILSTVAARRTIGNVQDVAVCLDCVTFERVEIPSVTIGKNKTVLKEFEDYIGCVVKDHKTSYRGIIKEYEKGTVLSMTEFPAEDGITLDIPLVVEETGWYELKSVLSRQVSNWTSQVTISIDGKTVLQNADEYSEEDLSYTGERTNIDFISSSYPMHRFRGICHLTAGEHTLHYYAKRRKDQTATDANLGVFRVCTVADNFAFSPLEDAANVMENKVSVTAYFDEGVTGVAMVALYADGDLVGIDFLNASDTWILNKDVSFAMHPDTVKILVWDNFLDMDPVTNVKEIMIK